MLRIQKPMSDGLRLGELLIGAGILTRDAVEAALTLAFASRLPLGRVLVSTGQLQDQQVDRYVAVQRRARSGGLGVLDARRVIQEMTWGAEHIEVGHPEKQPEGPASLLIDLLGQAGVLTKNEIPYVMRSSIEADITCGRLLLLRRRISPAFHRYCIELLVQYREGKLSFAKAADECRRLYQGGAYVDQQEDCGANASARKLGQLMVRAGFINETELYDALEVSLSLNRKLGEVLVDAGIVVQEVVDLCVQMLKRILSGEVRTAEAAVYLKSRHAISQRQGHFAS